MKLYYPHQIWHRVQLWQAAAKPKEIGWIGSVSLSSAKNLIVNNVYLFPKQSVTSGNFSVTKEDVAEFYEQLLTRSIDPGEFNYVGHGHVNMSTFKSTTDKEHDEEFLKGHKWGVSVTHNLKGETCAELYLWEPIETVITLDVEVFSPFYADDAEQTAAAKAALLPTVLPVTFASKDYRSHLPFTSYGYDMALYDDAGDYESMDLTGTTKLTTQDKMDVSIHPYPKRLRRRLKRLMLRGDDEMIIDTSSFKIEGTLLYKYSMDGSKQIVVDVDDVVEIANMLEYTGRDEKVKVTHEIGS